MDLTSIDQGAWPAAAYKSAHLARRRSVTASRPDGWIVGPLSSWLKSEEDCPVTAEVAW